MHLAEADMSGSNVIAYSVMQHAPQPYRFRSSTLRFQIPSPSSLLPDTRFFRIMRESQAWRIIASTAFTLRTWTRRTIWGDRVCPSNSAALNMSLTIFKLFLRFQGPANILVQSRGARITDSLTARDVNEIADTPAGAVQYATTPKSINFDQNAPKQASAPTKLSYATVRQDGKVDIAKS